MKHEVENIWQFLPGACVHLPPPWPKNGSEEISPDLRDVSGQRWKSKVQQRQGSPMQTEDNYGPHGPTLRDG